MYEWQHLGFKLQHINMYSFSELIEINIFKPPTFTN